MVKLAYDELSDEQAHLLFQSQAEGLFFTKKPMLFFGGSPCAAAGLEGCCSCLCLCRFHQPRGALITRLRRLQYAISFEMFDAVRELLSTGLVNLNDKAAACRLSGFMPIHAAVANGERFSPMTGREPHTCIPSLARHRRFRRSAPIPSFHQARRRCTTCSHASCRLSCALTRMCSVRTPWLSNPCTFFFCCVAHRLLSAYPALEPLSMGSTSRAARGPQLARALLHAARGNARRPPDIAPFAPKAV